MRNTARTHQHAGMEFGKPRLSGVKLPRNAHRGKHLGCSEAKCVHTRSLYQTGCVQECRELEEVEVIAVLLSSSLKGHRNWERLLTTGKKGILSKRWDPGNYGPGSLTSAPANVGEHVLLEVTSMHMTHKGVWEQPAWIYQGQTVPD